MFIPALCPRCTAVVVVPARGMLEFAGSRLYRCPACRSIVFQAIDDDPSPAVQTHVRPSRPPRRPVDHELRTHRARGLGQARRGERGRTAANRIRSAARPPAIGRDAIHVVLRRPGCRPGGCAGLCTDETLAAIYRAYRGPLLRQARTILGDPGLAEEVVQETFVRAWRACPSFDPDGSPMLVWLSVILRNLALDRMRARGRRPAWRDPFPTRRPDLRSLRRRRPAVVAGGTARRTGPAFTTTIARRWSRPSCWTDPTRTSPPSSVYRWEPSGAGPTTPYAGCGGSWRPKERSSSDRRLAAGDGHDHRLPGCLGHAR